MLSKASSLLPAATCSAAGSVLGKAQRMSRPERRTGRRVAGDEPDFLLLRIIPANNCGGYVFRPQSLL